jgi:hypothetical protein
MDLWDMAVHPSTPTPLPDGRFTSEEGQRLIALRQRLALRPTPVDLDIDERRLQFARWLVEHGRLSEDVSPSSGS